jgi:hypothetical protein
MLVPAEMAKAESYRAAMVCFFAADATATAIGGIGRGVGGGSASEVFRA